MTQPFEYIIEDFEMFLDMTVSYTYDEQEKRVYLESVKLNHSVDILDLLTETQKDEIVSYMIDNYAFEESYPEE
tara:strand:+ start:1032 stop:1253 length:222 start_codon:yes stop_codon:yes gene_type:complete